MRRILVRLAGAPSDGDTLKAARAAADLFGARLDGAFVRPRPASAVLKASPVEAIAAALGGAELADLDPADDRRQAGAEAAFRAGAGAGGAWRVLTGRSALALEAALADLLVETGLWSDPDPATDDLFHVLADSQSPVLLPGPDGGGLDLGVVAVAWDRALPAARALAAATPLLARAGRVVVLHDAAAGPDAVRPARDHLALHGVAAAFEGLDLAGHRPAEAVARRASALGAGLVAMGGYVHSHLTESLLGGFTQEMLARRRFAVLLRH